MSYMVILKMFVLLQTAAAIFIKQLLIPPYF